MTALSLYVDITEIVKFIFIIVLTKLFIMVERALTSFSMLRLLLDRADNLSKCCAQSALRVIVLNEPFG